MLKIIIEYFKNLDMKIKNIMKYGFTFSFTFCFFSIIILYTYHKLNTNPILFTIGTILFKTSLMFFTDFIICGLAFDKIIKQFNT